MERLDGGNMNTPFLAAGRVYKTATRASETIHRLLGYLRSKGLDWVPESFGIDKDGNHVLSYCRGIVPEDGCTWIWERAILAEAAERLRQLHDAASGFRYDEAEWLLENREPAETICHNDFAPYNCVFENGRFKGLLDFDVCSPGSRIWDIAHTVYRFVPLLPVREEAQGFACSPFSVPEMRDRLHAFLAVYGSGFENRESEVLHKTEERLRALADWTQAFAAETGNAGLSGHAGMYRFHADWIGNNF